MSLHPASYERGYVGSKPRTKQVQVTTSKAQLMPCSPDWDCLAVLLKADDQNSGNIYIGGEDMTGTSDGYKLGPGEAVMIPVDNPCKIYAVSDSGTNKLYVLVVQ